MELLSKHSKSSNPEETKGVIQIDGGILLQVYFGCHWMALSHCLFPGSQNQLCLLLLHGITSSVANMLAGFNISFVAWCKRQGHPTRTFRTPTLLGRIFEAPDQPVQAQGPGLSSTFQFWDQFLFDTLSPDSPDKVFLSSTCTKLWMPNILAEVLLLPLHYLHKIHMCRQYCYLWDNFQRRWK